MIVCSRHGRSPGSYDEHLNRDLASVSRWNQLGLILRFWAAVHTHYCHLVLLLSPEADFHVTVPWWVEVSKKVFRQCRDERRQDRSVVFVALLFCCCSCCSCSCFYHYWYSLAMGKYQASSGRWMSDITIRGHLTRATVPHVDYCIWVCDQPGQIRQAETRLSQYNSFIIYRLAYRTGQSHNIPG